MSNFHTLTHEVQKVEQGNEEALEVAEVNLYVRPESITAFWVSPGKDTIWVSVGGDFLCVPYREHYKFFMDLLKKKDE